MNTTKTMRLPPRRLMTSDGPSSRPNKRKERKGFDDEAHQLSFTAKVSKPTPPQSNQLLAGYLAHEFFTKGTLFGQAWDHPDVSMAASPPDLTEKRQAELHSKNYQSYVEVANLLKHGGAHLQGKWQQQQLRRLNVHEYQGAELMNKYGINVPKGIAISSVDEAKNAVQTGFPDAKELVVKSQILAGGRGLGTFKSGLKGGVHIVNVEQVEELAGKMLGQILVTKQTGPQSKVVSKESGMTLITAQDLDDAAEKAVKAAAAY